MPELRFRRPRPSFRLVALAACAALALGVTGAGVTYAQADPDRALAQRGHLADRDTADPDAVDRGDRDRRHRERSRADRSRADRQRTDQDPIDPDGDTDSSPESVSVDPTETEVDPNAPDSVDPNAPEPGGANIRFAPPDPPSSLVKGTPCTKKAVACVSLLQNKSWLFKKDELTGETVIDHGPVPVRTGGPGKETPLGDFVVEWKNKNHKSGEYFVPHGCVKGTLGCEGAPMNWAVFFAEGGIAFHEGTLAIRSSGCVRLSAKEAQFYYTYLQLGDKVEIRN